ncbi:MAG: hypothetical protein ACFBWO_12980 [Paracoccaceae bacterium]
MIATKQLSGEMADWCCLPRGVPDRRELGNGPLPGRSDYGNFVVPETPTSPHVHRRVTMVGPSSYQASPFQRGRIAPPVNAHYDVVDHDDDILRLTGTRPVFGEPRTALFDAAIEDACRE